MKSKMKLAVATAQMAQIIRLAFAVILLAGTAYAQQPSPAANSKPDDSAALKGNTLDQELFFCTTRIEAKSADGKQESIGTGFIFGRKFDEQHQILFIVTSRQVVDGFASATFSFVQDKDGKPNLGRECFVTVSNLQNSVFYNPDPRVDIALVPLEPILEYFKVNGQTPFFRALDEDMIPGQKAAEDLSAIQSVVFVGYPCGIRDEVNFLPIARRGFTASPYLVDFDGLPLFLVDASFFPGSSGSPVLVLDQGSYSTGDHVVIGNRAYFLGLIDQAYIHTEEGEIKFKPLPTQFVPVTMNTNYFNLGAVIKARAILDTISDFEKAYPLPK